MKRREFLKEVSLGISVLSLSAVFPRCSSQQKRPNILFCLSDDQSFEHVSAHGCKFVNTPVFDRIAREGVLFKNAFVSVPSCNPSRASILTGMPFYRLEEACMNHTPWPTDLEVYTDILSNVGYHVGYTGKGCAPTDWHAGGRITNPAGVEYNKYQEEQDSKGIVPIDYSGNFEDFLEQRPKSAPFCFWYGCRDPHRPFQAGIGLREGKKLKDVEVPPTLPDSEEVRSDLLDYAVHIESFDMHLGRMLKMLEAKGELDNTIIVVTGDNGMAFPRAKATCYDSGTHMPLAIRWGDKVKAGQVVDDFASFTDFAPTFLEAAGVKVPGNMLGKSLMPILCARKSGQIERDRDFIIVGVERHFPGGRKDGWGYPIRAIRNDKYLYIKNYSPDRWPVADPGGPVWPADDPTGGYGDVDGSPSKTYLYNNKENYPQLFNLAFGKRPAEELYEVEPDPYQMNNLADNPQYLTVKNELAQKLQEELKRTEDPRAIGKGKKLDEYARLYTKSL